MMKRAWGKGPQIDESRADPSTAFGVGPLPTPEWIAQGAWVGEGALVGLAGLAFGGAAVDPFGSSIANLDIPGAGMTNITVVVLAGFLAWASLGLSGAYDHTKLTRPVEGIRRILGALGLVFAALVVVLLLAARPIPIWILGWFAASVVGLSATRIAVGWLLARMVADRRMARFGESPLTFRQRAVKRASDVSWAIALSIVFAPLMAIIAAWIKIESPGPVLFAQRREGLNGELFTMLKFRTMYREFEDRDASLLVCRNDRRVTPGGRVLRRFSLDELPQLLNVLLGKMSIVGPRPHAVSARAANRPYRELVSDYGQRHRVKPGMTGLAQVRGWRGETDTVDKLIGRVECDLDYVDHWSFGRDLWIIFLTIGAVLSGRNSF